jgi:hypothetical protein
VPALEATVHWRFQLGADKPFYFDRLITYEDIHMPRDKLSALIGDGNARVACSFELADKDFGNGFSAHCTVSLACNQTERDVEDAADLASSLAARFTTEAVDTAEGLYRATLEPKHEERRGR